MDAIRLGSLSKRYGSRVGVDDLSLVVPSASMYGFLGPNGAGKTTTIRVLMGFLSPSGGRAEVFGHDCWRESPTIKAEIGYLPGDLRLPTWMTCGEALHLFGRVRGRDLFRVGRDLAGEFELDMSLRVGAMSRGTRQKLGLILAMAHEPQLLILDEPTASLDPLMQRMLYGRLRRAVAEGRTVLLSSHTLAEVEELCNHVAILRQGKLVACDSIDRLRTQARRRVTVQWKSIPTMGDGDNPIVEWHSQQSCNWNGTLRGTPEQFLQWAQGKPIEDFSLESADLTDIFESHYC